MSATERLARSRERLRRALSKNSAAPASASSDGAGVPPFAWPESLKAIPGASVILELVNNWWAQHPLRVASLVLADAAKALVRPIAQRHPLSLVAGAFVIGGLLAWKRPWRWLLTPALLAGLLPQLLNKVVAQISTRSWLDILSSMVQAQGSTKAPEPPVAPTAASHQASAH